VSNGCGGTCPCKECVTCTKKCGQVKDCGGTCANTDDGAPTAPTIISPDGTLVNPTPVSTLTTTLSWTNTDSRTDSYDVTLINMSTGVTTWTTSTTNTSVTTPTLNVGVIYRWYVRAVNTTCGTDWSVLSVSGYFQTNQVPTLMSVNILNSDSVLVSPETGNINHICRPSFHNSTNPTNVNFLVNLRDLDGASDIQSAQMRWHGVITSLSIGESTNINRVNTRASIDYTGVNDSGTYPIEIRIFDSFSNTGWLDSGYDWKVWNCNVLVTANVFDGSTGQACNNTGFSIPLTYSSISYKNMSGGADATNTLVWPDSYLPLVNGGDVLNPDGDLAASGRFTRLIDIGVGTTICPSGSQIGVSAAVSAYSINPSLTVDLSYLRDQENWFDGRGVDIKAKGEISSGVPITASSTLSVDNLNIGVSNNGLVSSTSFRNTNGWNDVLQYGMPHNWHYNKSLNDPKKYSYQTILNEYFNKNGVGVTGVTVVNTGDTGVMFVDGPLPINSNIVVAPNNYLMVVVSGAITIDPGVTRVDGILVADGGITAGGISDNQLVINGVLYSLGDIRITRSFTDKIDNNISPAVVVNFRPDLIFVMPGKLNKVLSGWSEN